MSEITYKAEISLTPDGTFSAILRRLEPPHTLGIIADQKHGLKNENFARAWLQERHRAWVASDNYGTKVVEL